MTRKIVGAIIGLVLITSVILLSSSPVVLAQFGVEPREITLTLDPGETVFIDKTLTYPDPLPGGIISNAQGIARTAGPTGGPCIGMSIGLPPIIINVGAGDVVQIEERIRAGLTPGEFHCTANFGVQGFNDRGIFVQSFFARQEVWVTIPEQNNPPDCTSAEANPGTLWPPNHKMKPISIEGVTDLDGDLVSLTITGITQDESVDGLGDGDTAPDGIGVGTDTAEVRSERSGTGDGRVYEISFTANDGNGGTCSGSVNVGVPHDKKDTPVDSGQSFDSTTS